MKILVACEFSGIVRRAFADRGHDAWSCDLLPAEDGSNKHIVGDVRDRLNDGWDMLMVAHPPCTRLCNSGVRWLSEPPTKLSRHSYAADVVEAYGRWNREHRLAFMWRELDAGADLFSTCWNAPIKHICAENPVMHRHAKQRIRNFEPAVQTVQPYWFGEPQFKATGLYLRNLPALIPTDRLTPPRPGTIEHRAWSRVHRMPPGPDRWRERSRFFPAIAAAMADQWGHFDTERAAA